MRDVALSFERSQASHNLSDPASLSKDCELMLALSIITASNSSHSIGVEAVDEQEPQITGALGQLLGHKEDSKEVVGDAILNGTIFSSNCGIILQINASTSHVEVYEAKAVNYTFMVTALTFIQVRSSITSQHSSQ